MILGNGHVKKEVFISANVYRIHRFAGTIAFIALVFLLACCAPVGTSPTTSMPAPTPAPICPTARGSGTILPAVSIYSITFVVNGVKKVVQAGGALEAVPGDQVQVRDVSICAGSFAGNGGEACVDFAPADKSGQEVVSEHKGTHLVQVATGLIMISNLDFAWTVDEGWSGISAVLNHWPPEDTRDLGCAGGQCERDDQMLIKFLSPAAITFDTIEQIELLSMLSGHRGKVIELAFSAGRIGLQLWDVKNGRRLRILPHEDKLLAVAFSPDGELLASIGHDGQIYLWGMRR